MRRAITFHVRLVTIIVVVVYYGSCYSSEDRSFNRSLVVSQIAGNAEKRNESSAVPSENGTANKQLRVPKCCAEGQVFTYRINVSDIECVVPFDDKTYSFADRLKRLLIFSSPETNESSFDIEYGKRCERHDFLNYPNDTFTLRSGGSQLDYQTDTINGSTADFCIEFITNENRLVPMLCPETRTKRVNVNPLYPITLSISALFMMATIFVLHFADKLKTLYGKLLLCHVTSLTIGYLFLIPTQIFHFYETCKPICFVAAVGTQFFILAGCFWLNVISFDVWCSFSLRRLPNSSHVRNNKKQFSRYSTYAWGCPIIITSITLLAEFWPKMSEIFPHPNLADNTCGFEDNVSARFYFYGPMGIVLLLNIVIFWAVFSKYSQEQRSSSRILSNNSESKRHFYAQQSRFAMCIKFFVVMGVCWIMEVVSALVGGPEHIWYATDICNSLQGVAIFFVTIRSRQTWQRVSVISLQSIGRNSSIRQTAVHSSSSRQTTVTNVKGT